MKRNFKDMWIQLALGQVLSYRLATAVAAKGLAISAAPGSKVLDACGPPRSARFLNPLEFHGKRRSPTPRQSKRWQARKLRIFSLQHT